MSFSVIPEGEERKVEPVNSAAIDGAPIAYIVVLAAIVTTLSFIPFSIVLASGGSMPLSQGIFPLVGWLLGPVAGATASGIGTLIGAFLAPYTAGIPQLSILGAILASFVAGSMVIGKKRRAWWFWLAIAFLLPLYIYASRAIGLNGISPRLFIAGAFVDLSGLLLWILPTRTLFARFIHSPNLGLVAIGLFGGTWMASGLSHLGLVAITYSIFNWPREVWQFLVPVVPVENLVRSGVGTAIGVGVIAGLRAIGLVKPREAIY
ncbi:hypothetical protein V0288_22620 [Pannus brasiliensis CCIBt3594]|uniref:ECF transporter S component n=1 Tax=Pannus brasiliensis CCIBt3594 TaxID=1427578 RepID=A0AAW9QXD9_9CHRO